MSFFWRIIQWLDGIILGASWSGEVCQACHKVHPIGRGYFNCPKEEGEKEKEVR